MNEILQWVVIVGLLLCAFLAAFSLSILVDVVKDLHEADLQRRKEDRP